MKKPMVLKAFKKLESFCHIPYWLFFVLIGVIILRLPNFFEPYSYGDETIYLTLGNGIRHGLTLYKDLHDNKPPLLYITAAVAGNLFWFKAMLLIANLIGITLFYKFSKLLFPKINRFSIVSTVIFSTLTTLPFFEGNIVNAENFMIIPTIIAFYIILFRPATYKNIFFAGVLFSISSLYKIPALFDLPATIVYWVLSNKLDKKNLKAIAINTLILFSGIAAPIFLTLIYYAARGAFSQYLVAAYLQNFGYLSSWRPDVQKESFFVKNAPLMLRGGLVILINAILYLLRKKVDKKFLFLVSWLSFSLFGVTLSERPYPHYLLQALAPASLLFALMFTSKSMLQVYVFFPLSLLFLVPFVFRFWHYQSINYYTNFVNLVSGKITKSQYLDYFGGRVKDNYEIAAIVDRLTKPSERVFVWQDSAQIYALANRFPPTKYVAGYHINDFSTTDKLLSQLSKNPPKVFVVFRENDLPIKISYFVKYKYLLYKETPEYQIWRFGGDYSRYIVH